MCCQEQQLRASWRQNVDHKSTTPQFLLKVREQAAQLRTNCFHRSVVESISCYKTPNQECCEVEHWADSVGSNAYLTNGVLLLEIESSKKLLLLRRDDISET